METENLFNTGIAFLFTEWMGENYIKVHGGWFHKFHNQLDLNNLKTTAELFSLWFADYSNSPSKYIPH